MMEWILILTMASYDGGTAVHSIVFPTQSSCLAAGTAWLQQPKRGFRYDQRQALCVARPVVQGEKP